MKNQSKSANKQGEQNTRVTARMLKINEKSMTNPLNNHPKSVPEPPPGPPLYNTHLEGDLRVVFMLIYIQNWFPI